jgi:PAS domain S-box-containing protein
LEENNHHETIEQTSAGDNIERILVINELYRVITTAFDLDELLKRITEEVAHIIHAGGCILRLLENGMLKIRSSYELPEGIDEQMELAMGEGIAGWVAQNNSPLLVEDTSAMPDHLAIPGLHVKSVICIPLKVRDTIIGTIGLYDKKDRDGLIIPFNQVDLETVEEFASISALAIDKAQLYQKAMQREQEAIDSKKKMDILFDSVQGGIITMDRTYKILSANRFIEQFTGMKLEDIVGRNCQEIFHDNGGVCPHCVTKATFETGTVNSTVQSRNEKYLELTSYPVQEENGEVLEAVIFIRDITKRVQYQEEIISLYKEVSETKDYVEGIINNSADAIVTSDLNGIITSWNRGAEETYGFTSQEAVGAFLPFVPEFLIEKEKENIKLIMRNNTINRIETVRKRKDGSVFEVSLTLSPVKNSAGQVIGISGISRDISERKGVEKELRIRNEELSRLYFISSTMRETLELDKLLRMTLTAVTMSEGLGFNRAILFLVDEERNSLKGAMGVGPSTHDEAWQIWGKLSGEHKTLTGIIQDIEIGPLKKDSFLDRLSINIEIPISENTMLTRAVKEKKPVNVRNVQEEPLSDIILTQQLGTHAYAVVPLVSRDKVIGAIWVDNHFNSKPILDEDMRFLSSFSGHIATAIENARLFEQVKMTEQELENIFDSISDMVYIVTEDYVIKNVNMAVCKKLKMNRGEIIGKKCYEVFHGTDKPWSECPHHKTVEKKTAFVKEVEDSHLGGTFIISSSPLFDSAGNSFGTVNVVRDITELKNLREKLNMSERMAALGEVAARVAHEIRNPLVSVGGFARRLEKKLDSNLKEYATIISNEVSRLENILNDILSFVKEGRLIKEPVNINELAEEIMTLIKPDMEDKGIALVKELSASRTVQADPNGIKESVVNLLTNAIQAIGSNGTITLRTFENGDFSVIEIKDTGKGMSEEILQYIFDPFFTTKVSGTGLGLTITHKIIERHKGKIEVESRPDAGSTLRIFLPLQ